MESVNKLIARSCAVFGASLLSAPVMAAVTIDVPEPGVLSLLGAGGVVALVMYIRKRH